ncbi:TfoX/Sxy family protein [Mycobacterium sp. Aquia_216]|uniref:TfoX/Sxy family protein n=1 Tax=Mycobacterium sp. Aquia_216 TaxID=2991729 RepID=UPI00227C9BC5|nr:TfoX/Sxy family protein [Mycobacterium sp. Aquia_216]WAJ42690.1 TfoX/Sxy family protein [Mycobacterium sp. Aquia_216]
MAYDLELADRIRELLAPRRGVDEKAMFGGLAFLIGGHLAVAASGKGGLMVRVPPEDTAKLLERQHVSPMVMAGRETRGWLRVDAEGVKTKRQLESWITRGVGYAGSLPPK